MDRNQVTQKIVTAKVSKKMTWAQIAERIGLTFKTCFQSFTGYQNTIGFGFLVT